MHLKTIEKITDAALAIEEYVSFSERLRAVAIVTKEPNHRRDLCDIADMLETQVLQDLFSPTYTKTAKLFLLMQQQKLTEEELALKTGESLQIIRQRINALKAGGIKINKYFSNATFKVVTRQITA